MSQGIDISDFSGGLNTRDGAGAIAENEIAECLNCYLVKRGYAKRKGFSRYTGSNRIDGASAGRMMVYAPFVSGAKIVGVAGNNIAYKDSSSWTDITGAVTLTATRPAVSTMVNDNLVACNGTDPAWYWDGSAASASTLSGENIPTAPTVCEQFAGRLFLAQGRTLYWSGWMGDWNKFNSKDYQPFNSSIMGLKVVGDSQSSYLVIQCERGVHVCQFSPDVSQNVGGRGAFTFDTISETNGCAASASVQECHVPNLGYALIWADYDGLKLYNPSIGIDKLTDKIRDDWEALNLGYLSEATGTVYRPKGWYVFNCRSANGTGNDKQIIIDLNNANPGAADPDKRWVIGGIFNWSASVFGTVRENGVEKLIGCDTSGYWNQYDNSQNDNGVAITGYFKTRTFDCGLPQYRKGLQGIVMHYTYFGQFDIDLTIYYDYLGENYATAVVHAATAGKTLGTFVLDQDILGANEQLVVVGQELSGWGRTFQIKVSNDQLGQPFRIHKLQPQFRVGRMAILS